MSLYGKRVVLTGASSGIGQALVTEFLKEGCVVLGVSRTMEQTGTEHEGLYRMNCDVSDPAQVDRLFHRAQELLGGIDVFVANAGFAHYEFLGKPDWEHIRHIHDTNTFSPIYSAMKLKHDRGNEPWHMVMISSAAGQLSMPGYALYCATKAAMRGFANAWQAELAPGQFLTTVYPIGTRTAFFRRAGSPEPWPLQNPEHVARQVIRGIIGRKRSVYPSSLFRVLRLFPPLMTLYSRIGEMHFRRTQGKRRGEHG